MKLAVFVILCFSLFFSADATADSRGVQVVVKDTQGREVTLYKGSHALLIGASRYTAGWPSLHTVPSEIADVKAVLENHGLSAA